ncbi:MAG: radical SAM protein, partial [Candidatus Aenigmarchaeota archaeon]|nr:radical SAM protein [Candidatus Aenigmarchaeota archaeon]
PNMCTFCLYPQTLMGRAFRPRSAENFVRELVWISKNLHVKEIFVEDDTFTTDKERVLKICSLIKEHDLNIKWSANVRADVPYEVLQAMKDAGCRMVIVGFESGNQAILNTIRKGITIEMAEDFVSNAKRAGLKIFGCFMIGLPGETHDTIEETFKFAQRLSPDMVFFQQAVPFPGTEFYNWCKMNKYITANDWSEWLDKNGQLDCIVSYPDLSNKEICKIKDKLMVRFYTAPKHVLHTITHNLNPSEMVRLGKAGKSFAKYLVKRRT